LQRVEKETESLSQEISTLRAETQQEIETVDSKFDTMRECVSDKLNAHMEENRLELVKLCKYIEDNTNVTGSKLEEHKSEMEKGLGAVRKEMSSFKQGVTEKTINTLKEKLKVAERDSSAKLEELYAHLDKLQEQVTVGCRQVEPSVGSNEQALRIVTTGGEQASCSSRVGDLGEDHVRNRREL
jgi:SMC interacting uncharacterized protein involved in chromosome segregation